MIFISLLTIINYGHENIIKYCNRPWDSVHEMNKGLVDNLNKVVGPNDLLIFVGDVFFNKRSNMDTSMFPGACQINIIGNHCKGSLDKWQHKFQSLKLNIEGKEVHLNHYPLCERPTCKNAGYAYYLSGHIHSSPEDHKIPFVENEYDVGVDRNNYFPISWSQIQNIMKYQKENQKGYNWNDR